MSKFRSRLAVLMALAVVPAVIALFEPTSNDLIPAALLGVGLLVIALAVRRAQHDAKEPFEQAASGVDADVAQRSDLTGWRGKNAA